MVLARPPEKLQNLVSLDYLRGNQLAVLVLAGGPAAAPFHQPSAGLELLSSAVTMATPLFRGLARLPLSLSLGAERAGGSFPVPARLPSASHNGPPESQAVPRVGAREAVRVCPATERSPCSLAMFVEGMSIRRGPWEPVCEHHLTGGRSVALGQDPSAAC